MLPSMFSARQVMLLARARVSGTLDIPRMARQVATQEVHIPSWRSAQARPSSASMRMASSTARSGRWVSSQAWT